MPFWLDCQALLLPTVSLSATSASLHGYYRSVSGTGLLAELYPSPRSSSVVVEAMLLPAGGLTSSYGLGGVGELPMKSYLQGSRPAASHAILVQTPHLHTNMATLALLVQCYDAFGHSDVSSANIEISASLDDALHQTVLYRIRRRRHKG